MATFRIPGPIGLVPYRIDVDDGTLCRLHSPLPAQVDLHPLAKVPLPKPKASWNPDPHELLSDKQNCPAFVQAARAALKYAVDILNLKPQVIQAYRSPEESDNRHQAYMKGGPRAARAWESCHNYGLAMDVGMVDDHIQFVWDKPELFEKFNAAAKLFDLYWGKSFNDLDHWEYHPAWSKAADKTMLKTAKADAMKEAHAAHEDDDWMAYFWQLAGAA